MSRKIAHILWGLLFIAAAVLLILKMYKLVDFEIFFEGWWTLFLIIPAFISIIQNGIRVPNSILLCIGVLLLLKEQGIIPENTLGKLIGPAILLIIGIAILTKGFIKSPNKISSSDNHEDNPEYIALFSGTNVKNNSTAFLGGSSTAIFGGNEIDLSDVILKGDCTFTVTSIFGGNDIIAPKNARVEMRGVPIFGGNENKAKSSDDPAAYKIVFDCTSIFGGTEIK